MFVMAFVLMKKGNLLFLIKTIIINQTIRQTQITYHVHMVKTKNTPWFISQMSMISVL